MKCPLCHKKVKDLGKHLRVVHGEEALVKEVLAAKERGLPDAEIGKIFGLTFRQLEKILTEAYGANLSFKPKRKVKTLEPDDFEEETTTVWSFKKRGSWATHSGAYRGNWSPYIPRNVILKYSKEGELVLDPFVGGGTTAVEAKLLRRRFVGYDINPAAVQMARESVDFQVPWKTWQPKLEVGDARDLKEIADESVDLICAHPPYAGIVKYSTGIPGDLSGLRLDQYLTEMKRVAQEFFRVLKPGRTAAVLVGDTRRNKRVVPIGFEVLNLFLEAGFSLRELVIKRQHNCRTTGFWYQKSIKHNFLLLAHEYLFIFEKNPGEIPPLEEGEAGFSSLDFKTPNPERLETTSVWVFPKERVLPLALANLRARYGEVGAFTAGGAGFPKGAPTLFLSAPRLSRAFLDGLKEVIRRAKFKYLAVHLRDFRDGRGRLVPAAKVAYDALKEEPVQLKEIIVVHEEGEKPKKPGKFLEIRHSYVLLYERGDLMRRPEGGPINFSRRPRFTNCVRPNFPFDQSLRS